MINPSEETAPAQRRRWRITESRLRYIALLGVLAIAAAAVLVLSQLGDFTKTAGYPTVFLISLFGNATLILPVPAMLVVCSGGVLLNPLVVGVVGGAGQALGETTGYLAGYSGRGLASKSRFYNRFKPWMERRGWIVVLLFALVPNPLVDIVGMTAGAMHMPFWQYFTFSLIGKTIRSVGVAFACSLGYDFYLLSSH